MYEHRCSLKYASVEDALWVIARLGIGTLMAKVDVRKAYRNIPIYPPDRMLLGMAWQDDLFIDSTLPFGLRSAPKIFTAVADAAEWIARQKGVNSILHYLDDWTTLPWDHQRVGNAPTRWTARSLLLKNWDSQWQYQS